MAMNLRLAPLASLRFPRFFRCGRWLAVILLVGGVALWSNPARAANATWNGTTNAAWVTGTNWSTTPVPGTGDTATFDNAGNGNTVINLGGGVTVNTVLFDDSLATLAAYTIGSGTVGSQTLTLDNLGAVTVNNNVLFTPQLFNAAIALSGGATFTNSGSSPLTFAGGVGGTGNLVLNNNGFAFNGITLSTTAVNNSGTITNSGIGTGNTLISAPSVPT
jgi:hypothetical protein